MRVDRSERRGKRVEGRSASTSSCPPPELRHREELDQLRRSDDIASRERLVIVHAVARAGGLEIVDPVVRCSG